MYHVIDQFNLKDKRVFIRTDYNVPVRNGKIEDTARILASLPTIQHALSQNARVIIGSHLGRPKGVSHPAESLLPVAEYLSEILQKDVIFPEDCVGDASKKLVSDLRGGEVILLENLRFHPEEEKNDPHFSQQLASLAEVYIDDSFGTIHRAHASTNGMVSFFKEKGIGFLIQKELKFLQNLLATPQKPFVTILGGAKVSDKIGVVENLMNHVDTFIIGGAMAYTFLRARGVKVGRSLVEESKIHQAEKLLNRAEVKGVEILLPIDSVLASQLRENVPTRIATLKEDWGDDRGLDIGPATIKIFSEKIKGAKTLFWNGPMGAFETKGFEKGTFALALAVVESGAVSVIGGGDSIFAIKQSGYQDKVSHLSTGGGAALAFLEGQALPGLKVLET